MRQTGQNEADASRRPARPSPRARGRMIAVALAVVLALCAGAVGWYMLRPASDAQLRTRLAQSAQEQHHANLSDPEGIIYDTQVMPLSKVEAEQLNALRPADVREVVPARPFAIPLAAQTQPQFASALECLQQAIYYEAANESEAGQRAVAQVVLNRVRHPAFPHSVCGVVYQGSYLKTGCQFTFTCDGSLARVPSVDGFARARRIALAALSGWVEGSVGNATHYHANYVLPYWAGSLDKIVSIGAHIFYGMRGPAGAPRAFNARYDALAEFVRPGGGAESLDLDEFDENALPTPADAAQQPRLPSLAEDEKGAAFKAHEPSGQLHTQPDAPLRADDAKGQLMVQGGNSQLIAN